MIKLKFRSLSRPAMKFTAKYLLCSYSIASSDLCQTVRSVDIMRKRGDEREV